MQIGEHLSLDSDAAASARLSVPWKRSAGGPGGTAVELADARFLRDEDEVNVAWGARDQKQGRTSLSGELMY